MGATNDDPEKTVICLIDTVHTPCPQPAFYILRNGRDHPGASMLQRLCILCQKPTQMAQALSMTYEETVVPGIG